MVVLFEIFASVIGQHLFGIADRRAEEPWRASVPVLGTHDAQSCERATTRAAG
jgi:hypothetical protein